MSQYTKDGTMSMAELYSGLTKDETMSMAEELYSGLTKDGTEKCDTLDG